MLSSTLKSNWNKQSGHSTVDWKFSIGLHPLYKLVSEVDSVLLKTCSLRKNILFKKLRRTKQVPVVQHGAHC